MLYQFKYKVFNRFIKKRLDSDQIIFNKNEVCLLLTQNLVKVTPYNHILFKNKVTLGVFELKRSTM